MSSGGIVGNKQMGRVNKARGHASESDLFISPPTELTPGRSHLTPDPVLQGHGRCAADSSRVPGLKPGSSVSSVYLLDVCAGLGSRHSRNPPDGTVRNAPRRPENHSSTTALSVSCSSVSNNTLSSPITSKTTDADGITAVVGCRRGRAIDFIRDRSLPRGTVNWFDL
ncbi:hypothetical protein EYF80_048912 [Liparis tanakae]|uniref:Uncharacterized protein n=1 Tax=Liparis tanakae TaxID=230148 RepID=A0A4Z2FJ17_9TELE|nr:hypothetical protein EYF80_048912 [Liparis tanakae]